MSENFYFENWSSVGIPWSWMNFTIKEVAQRGKGWEQGKTPVLVVPDFLDKIQTLRNLCDFPFSISSWYRSPEHNANVSSTGENGPHTTGKAVDILCYGEQAQKLIQCAVALKIPGIGVSQKGDFSKRFIHLDDARSTPALWSY